MGQTKSKDCKVVQQLMERLSTQFNEFIVDGKLFPDEVSVLEECKELFIINQAIIKGRRKALTNEQIKYQVAAWKIERKSKRASIDAIEELKTEEIKKIVKFRLNSKKNELGNHNRQFSWNDLL